MLVELACATTLSPAYDPGFFNRLLGLAPKDGMSEGEHRKVVLIVCGGVKISLQELEEYDERIKASLEAGGQRGEIFCNGERWLLEDECIDI